MHLPCEPEKLRPLQKKLDPAKTCYTRAGYTGREEETGNLELTGQLVKSTW